jgi:hypothetical protein
MAQEHRGEALNAFKSVVEKNDLESAEPDPAAEVPFFGFLLETSEEVVKT